MSLFTRRIVFYLLSILFIIVAPLLIGYTSGWRYSFKQGRLVKTGALSLSSVPDKVDIILNGKLLDVRTPTLLTNIIPGNYEIILELKDYYSWRKTLRVENEKTTFAHNIPLFKKSAPEFQTKYPISDAPKIESPDITLLKDFKHYKVVHDTKLDKIVIIDNNQQIRLAELEGNKAIWREKDIPLLFSYSQHEVWQFNPEQKTAILITRLIEDIQEIIPIPKIDAIILILKDRVQIIDTDPRDHQNLWNLAKFDAIKNATLADDEKTLEIIGTYQGKEGMWTLELQ